MHKCQQTFSSQEDGEPEAELSYDNESVTGSVRITRICSDCSTETKEYNFDIEQAVEIPEGCKSHELDVEVVSCEAASKVIPGKKPRYNKTQYGFDLTYEVRCEEDYITVATGTVSDYIQASAMDELE